jgi:streptogramin lyase
MRLRGAVLLIGLAFVLPLFTMPGSSQAKITACLAEEPPTAGVSPQHIVAGPENEETRHMYFTGTDQDFIGGIRPNTGRQDLAYTNNIGDNPHRIVLGPDGNVWWTSTESNSVHRLRIADEVIQSVEGFDGILPTGITVGRSAGGAANIWVANQGTDVPLEGSELIEIRTSGVVHEHHVLDVEDQPVDVEMDPTQTYVYFTAPGSNRVGRIDIQDPGWGVVEYLDGVLLHGPKGITAAENGSMYFAELFGDRIIRITPSGELDVLENVDFEFPDSGPADIVAVGNVLWFTEQRASRIGKITLSEPGVVLDFAEFDTPTPCSSPKGINPGPNGTIWFTEGKPDVNGVSHVGRILDDVIMEFVVCLSPPCA